MNPPTYRSQLARICILALAYFAVGKVGFALTVVGPSAAPVWSPTGVGLAALLLWGYRVWPGVLLGALLLRIDADNSYAWGFALAAANTFEGLAAAWLTDRFARGRFFYERPFDVFRFAFFAAVLCSLFSPPINAVELDPDLFAVWSGDLFRFNWWLGDVVSVVVLTPLLVVFSTSARPVYQRIQVLEYAALVLLLALVAFSVFGEMMPEATRGYLRPNICLPFLIWAAFRFGTRETVTVVFLLGVIALWGTISGLGIFAASDPAQSLLILQGYMAPNAIMCLAVSAIVTQHNTAEQELRRARDQLEERVRQRTAELSAANRSLEEEMLKRQQAQEAHSQVLGLLDEAQETERRRISRELHDQMGQELTAMKLSLKMIKKQDPLPQSVQQCVDRLEDLTDSVMINVHRLAWELRPVVLDDFGLETALRRFTEEWGRHTGLAVDFHSDQMTSQRLSPGLETMIYRITQEALTNVAKHAKARRVSVLLERRADHLSLIVEDDGQGFDADAILNDANPRHKLGLLGMKERVTLGGGAMEIESAPGQGSTVFVRVPLVPQIPKN